MSHLIGVSLSPASGLDLLLDNFVSWVLLSAFPMSKLVNKDMIRRPFLLLLGLVTSVLLGDDGLTCSKPVWNNFGAFWSVSANSGNKNEDINDYGKLALLCYYAYNLKTKFA